MTTGSSSLTGAVAAAPGGRRAAATIGDSAEDVLALADALELEDPVLVGCSAGAAIVLEAAGRAPSYVRAVVAVDGPGTGPRSRRRNGSASCGRRCVPTARKRSGNGSSDWYGPLADPSLLEWTTRQILDVLGVHR